MNKLATSLTLAVVAIVGMTAQAGICDESVTQSKQSEVTTSPDGSTTQATSEQTEVNKDTPAPMPAVSSETETTTTQTVKPAPVVSKTKISKKVSTSYKRPRIGSSTVQTSVHVQTK